MANNAYDDSFDDDSVQLPESRDNFYPDEPSSSSSRYSRGPASRGKAAENSSGLRSMPHDNEAEQSVLGAMLLNNDSVVEIIEELAPADFYIPRHQIIFQAILDLFSQNKSTDPVIVADYLDRHNNLDRAGGTDYLLDLTQIVPTTLNAPYYAKIVAEKATLRQLVNAGTRMVQLGFEGNDGAEIDTLVDMAQQEVFAISQGRTKEDYVALSGVLEETLEELDEIAQIGGQATGIATGFPDLDAMTNGLHGGQMIIIAARPGVGKSTLGLDFVRSCSLRQGKASVIFSLEMSRTEIGRRLLSAETEINLQKMNSGNMDDQDWVKVLERSGEIRDAPLFIDESPNLTMMEIRAKARRLSQQADLKLIVVDYLQLMSSGKKVESRQQEVSEFSRQLKLLAKELDVPLIAISQLNRGPESRTDKRPQLADLRESGSLEQDADMVFLLYRPDSQEPDNERAGEADIIIAKHRGGPIGTVEVAHQLNCSRFVPMKRMGMD
ncbi:replicative DNA helicase [Corynebacterium poyangense]|uniref:Replicative DNA helicase n=1 Tax=Corynebacterium poyangense TaxID=2684405 RepID=A0A7H0SRU7_9CORY|nr:replicative DNA helicase [Corynebacterium poyangense]QNQ91272.1 replicative DNA helicase [Corynebacterium poyangense]